MIRSLGRSSVFFLAVLAAACGDSSGGGGSTGSGDGGTPDGGGGGGGPYASISLSQTDVRIPRFMMTAFAVTAVREDGSRKDVTEQATARSSDANVATVDHGQGAQMLIHSKTEGTAVITVAVEDVTQDVKVTVTAN